MASHHFFDDSNNQVRDVRSVETLCGRSKTQMCLHKILGIISTIPPSETPDESPLNSLVDTLEQKGRGLGVENSALFDIDLNMSLVAPVPETEEKSLSPAENAGASARSGVEKVEESEFEGSVGESDLDCLAIETNHNGGEREVILGIKAAEDSELMVPQVQSFETDDGGVFEQAKGEEEFKIEAHAETRQPKQNRSDECFELLIEAAKLVSGTEFEDEGAKPKRPSQNHKLCDEVRKEEAQKMSSESRSKRGGQYWMVDLYGELEDVSPVVRSKRGRTQVLPSKFRDSVLEPLSRLSRHRSATISAKRKSR